MDQSVVVGFIFIQVSMLYREKWCGQATEV